MSHSQANRLMILAAILWGTGNVALQTVLAHIGPFTAVGLRCLIAALVFIPILGFTSRLSTFISRPARWPAIASTLSFAAAVTLSQAGYGLTTVTNAGFFINTTTVITPILAWAVLKQRPHISVWLAAFLILSGATFMSGGSLHGVQSGDALCLASAVCYGFWMIGVSAYARQGGDASALTLAQFSFTAMVCLPLGFAIENVTMPAIIAALPELLFLGVFSTAGAYYLQIVAQNHTSASEAAVIGSGEAVVGAVAAYFLLDEVMTGLSAIGALLVSAGIVLVQCPAKASDLFSRSWWKVPALPPQQHPRGPGRRSGPVSLPGSLRVPAPSRATTQPYKRRIE